jgi:hypothetical protein
MLIRSGISPKTLGTIANSEVVTLTVRVLIYAASCGIGMRVMSFLLKGWGGYEVSAGRERVWDWEGAGRGGTVSPRHGPLRTDTDPKRSYN